MHRLHHTAIETRLTRVIFVDNFGLQLEVPVLLLQVNTF